MITKKKLYYRTTTKTKCLEDVAIDKAGGQAALTFKAEDKIKSNDYIIPFHAICFQKVKFTHGEEQIDDETCVIDEPGKPRIIGADDVEINQGIGIDLREGVIAVDSEGNPIDFTVEPSEIDKCDVGVHTVIYTATDREGNTTTVIRNIGICQVANPTISGATDIVVAPNEEFNPLDGVTAVDGNGNEVEVELKEN